MPEPIRLDRVEQLLAAKLDLADEPADVTQAEREAARHVGQAAAQTLVDVGMLPTVLDMTWKQAGAIAAAYSYLHKWGWGQLPHLNGHKLSDMLKIVPRDEAGEVMAVLRWAGLAPPE